MTELFPKQQSGISNEELAQIAIVTQEDIDKAIQGASPEMREAIEARLVGRPRNV